MTCPENRKECRHWNSSQSCSGFAGPRSDASVRAYRVATGLELRLEYEDRPNDVHRSQLFRVRDDDAIATMADQWHLALRAKGFVGLEIVRQPDGRQEA